jgi:hypothetical protein
MHKRSVAAHHTQLFDSVWSTRRRQISKVTRMPCSARALDVFTNVHQLRPEVNASGAPRAQGAQQLKHLQLPSHLPLLVAIAWYTPNKNSTAAVDAAVRAYLLPATRSSCTA